MHNCVAQLLTGASSAVIKWHIVEHAHQSNAAKCCYSITMPANHPPSRTSQPWGIANRSPLFWLAITTRFSVGGSTWTNRPKHKAVNLSEVKQICTYLDKIFWVNPPEWHFVKGFHHPSPHPTPWRLASLRSSTPSFPKALAPTFTLRRRWSSSAAAAITSPMFASCGPHYSFVGRSNANSDIKLAFDSDCCIAR